MQKVHQSQETIMSHNHETALSLVKEAVGAARKAQALWLHRRYSERAASLLKIRDYISVHAEELAECISRATGKTRIDAVSTEVLSTAMAISYYATEARKVLHRKRITGGGILTINKISYLERVPFGVIGIISPWNYPFAIPFHEIAMALITGNGVILKVASQTKEVGVAIEKAVEAGGLPDGLYSLIDLPGTLAGDAFINGGIDKLFFTGSVAVGKELMAKAAPRLLPLSLELGGNDAMIVCDDADLTRAANGALWAGMSNAGQSCAAVERIYVLASVYDKFLSLLKTKMGQLRVGEDTRFDVEIGSLTTDEQYTKVKELLDDARAKGAILHTYAEVPQSGRFIAPTIVENVTSDMRLTNEEIFGPVVAVAKVGSDDEAVSAANHSSLGLTASVWSRNASRAESIASRLRVGSVMINDHLMSHGLAETPWGGFKESGIGRTHGRLGLEEMTQPRVIVKDILPFVKRNMWWYPHNENIYQGLLGALRFLYPVNFAQRLRGGMQLIKVFARTFTDE
jgi:succinate-semialdehyde dehydrogenase/glutarate-semialdehyde dehydrogenase